MKMVRVGSIMITKIDDVTHEQSVLDMLNIDESTPYENMVKRVNEYFNENRFDHFYFNPRGIYWLAKWKIELYNEYRSMLD